MNAYSTSRVPARIHSNGEVIINHRGTDIGVSAERGYVIYKRAECEGEIQIADKLSHLIGKRIVLKPKKDSQITEADFLAAVDAAA